ncbi:MAG: 50S ribosomal protein L24 [Candidatus Liptonbacteria bacterium]|nr:50S ribosomal protein L24 [Candidatus Liptonbacteria bacterium]
MNIKKGDQVKILSGKDRGKTGAVLNVFPKDGKISVEGLNVYKKRVRPKRQGQKGETVLVPRSFYASKAMVICSNCKEPARLGHRLEGKKKVRYCKKCKAAI